MVQKLITKEYLEANQNSIRAFFHKWRKLISLSELARRGDFGIHLLNDSINSKPRKQTIAGYNNFNKDMLREIRKEFANLRKDLDKVIADIDDYVGVE